MPITQLELAVFTSKRSFRDHFQIEHGGSLPQYALRSEVDAVMDATQHQIPDPKEGKEESASKWHRSPFLSPGYGTQSQ